jgi:hypothetical protein
MISSLASLISGKTDLKCNKTYLRILNNDQFSEVEQLYTRLLA